MFLRRSAGGCCGSSRIWSHTAEQISSGNRRSIKTCCCFSTLAAHRGNGGRMAEEVFTQWIFLLPPISFGESVLFWRKRRSKDAFVEFRTNRDAFGKQLHFITGRCFPQEKGIHFFVTLLSNTHTHKTGNSWARRWQTLSNVFRTHTPLPKQWEMYLVQEGSKPTQVICRVWSPGRADTGRPHGVRELEALTRSCCSVLRVCFNCESKSASDMRFTARGGWGGQKRERPAQSAGAW